MDKLENKLDWSVSREAVENAFSKPFTDREWVVIAGEIENIIEHYVWLDLPDIIADLDNIVAEHDNWDKISETDSV